MNYAAIWHRPSSEYAFALDDTHYVFRLRAWDVKMYRFLRYRSYPALVNWMPFRLQGKVTTLGYRFYRRKLKCS